MDTGPLGVSTTCLWNCTSAERSLTDDYAEVAHVWMTPPKVEGMVRYYWLCINVPARVWRNFCVRPAAHGCDDDWGHCFYVA